jgi:membrane protein DedA with SNARE-associated domain
LIFEPLSLLLLPGMAVGVSVTGPHDLDPKMVVEASVIFYFVLFLAALEWRTWRQRRRRHRGC